MQPALQRHQVADGDVARRISCYGQRWQGIERSTLPGLRVQNSDYLGLQPKND